jgi:hypothetical protein
MAVLLDLSPEVISLILDHIQSDSTSLDNLCLAANHNLLELVRPYTWREVNTTLGDGRYDNEETNRASATRLHSFCTDSIKAAAVRSLNITIFGFFPFPLSCLARTP